MGVEYIRIFSIYVNNSMSLLEWIERGRINRNFREGWILAFTFREC